MANFFEGIVNAIKQPLEEAKFLGKVVTGKTSLKDAFGEHQRMMNGVTVPILGDNKLSKNSDAVAATILGGIFAAPAIGGAMGAGGAGSVGGAGAGLSSGTAFTGSFGGGVSGASAASSGASAGLSSGTAFTGSMGSGISGSTSTAAPTTTSWFDTLMENVSNFTDNMDASTPEGKQEQDAFTKSFSEMLTIQRQLAATPPAQRNKLLAQRNGEELTKIFKPMFGED